MLYAGCPGRRRLRGDQTPHAPRPVPRAAERRNRTQEHKNARDLSNKASIEAWTQTGKGLTRRSVGITLHARELAHLVLDVRVERDVDGEGDEREEGREEGCEGGEEGEGDVGGEGEEEGD